MSAADLAKKIGYRSLNRSMRWIHDFEREGKFFTELLENITEALELDRRYIDQLIEKDKEQQKREFEGWVNVPIK